MTETPPLGPMGEDPAIIVARPATAAVWVDGNLACPRHKGAEVWNDHGDGEYRCEHEHPLAPPVDPGGRNGA